MNGMTPLYAAANNGHFEICKLIVENVEDKNPAYNSGYTPVDIAAKNGHFDICILILKRMEDKRIKKINLKLANFCNIL